MNVAFIIGKFPSLSETFILSQITGLIDLGYKVDIYATHPDAVSKTHPDVEKYKLLDVTYYFPQVPSNYFLRLYRAIGFLSNTSLKDYPLLLQSLNLFKYRQLASSLRLWYSTLPFIQSRLSYGVIICHFGNNGILGMNLRMLGVVYGKLLTVFHGYDMSQFLLEEGDDVYKHLFIEGDLFLPVSEYWKQQLIKLGCDERKTRVHHMGIDCRQFMFVPRVFNSDQPIQIVSVARLVEKKGIEYGIRAIAQLKETYDCFQYTIIGDGPLHQNLKNLSVELGVSHHVQFLGWKQRDELIEILNHAQFFLAPSVTSSKGDQEGIPVALMEAMAMGMVVISTNHSGIPELVENRVSGFLAPERDVHALAEILMYLVQHPEVWAQVGRRGRLQVENYFDSHQLNQHLAELIQSF